MKFYLSAQIFLQLSLLLTSVPIGSQEINKDDFSIIHNRVDRLLEAYIENEETVGISVTANYKGTTIYSRGFGYADMEMGVAATDSTLFRLASVSKLFTAVAIAKLAETGTLDLDDPIEKYVPTFSGKRWKPTIRQIASHTGGARGYLAKDFQDGKDIFKDEFPTTESALDIFVSDSLLFEPGTGYKYSTFGFTLLTAVIENVTGKKFEDYLADEIVAPLELGPVIADRPERIIKDRSSFYDVTKERQVRNASFIRSDFKFGGGGLLASSSTLAKFGTALIHPGLLRKSTLDDDLFREQSKKNGKSVHVGLAWRIGEDEHFGRVYHHSGALPGGRSVLMIWPDREFVIAATSNTTNAPYYAEQFAQVLSHLFLTGISTPKQTPSKFGGVAKKMVFSENGVKDDMLLTIGSDRRGNLEVPPLIKDELEKRKFPVQGVLPVLDVYPNIKGSSSIIVSSDIGLHRLELKDLFISNSTTGFVEELSNKFRWEIKQHGFRIMDN